MSSTSDNVGNDKPTSGAMAELRNISSNISKLLVSQEILIKEVEFLRKEVEYMRNIVISDTRTPYVALGKDDTIVRMPRAIQMHNTTHDNVQTRSENSKNEVDTNKEYSVTDLLQIANNRSSDNKSPNNGTISSSSSSSSSSSYNDSTTATPHAPIRQIVAKSEPIKEVTSSIVKNINSSPNYVKWNSNAQVIAHIIIGLMYTVQVQIESKHKSFYRISLQHYVNTLASTISNICKARGIDMIDVLHNDLLLSCLNRKNKDDLIKINGETLATIRDNRITSDVYRFIYNIMPLLKAVPECIPPPGSDILLHIDPKIIDDNNTILLDINFIAVRNPTEIENNYAALSIQQIKYYVEHKLAGNRCADCISYALQKVTSKSKIVSKLAGKHVDDDKADKRRYNLIRTLFEDKDDEASDDQDDF